MAITDPQTRERIKYHLGYPNLQIAGSIQLGIPTPLQTMFLVDAAMDNITEPAITRVLKILNTLDNIECLLSDVAGHMAVAKSGGIELRANEHDLIEENYGLWMGRLADQLGAPPYPYSNRVKQAYAKMAGSIPVRG